jgi:hypothetical protein
MTGLSVTSSITALTQPARVDAYRERASGPDPLLYRRLGALVLEVLDRERVIALQHLHTGAALLGYRLPVLAGTDAQRDHASP